MRKINKRVYEVAGIKFDDSHFEDGPPPLESIEFDTSSYSVDQMLTDQHIELALEDDYNTKEFNLGKENLQQKANQINNHSQSNQIKEKITQSKNRNISRPQKIKRPANTNRPAKLKRKSKKVEKSSSSTTKLLFILMLALALYYAYSEGLLDSFL